METTRLVGSSANKRPVARKKPSRLSRKFIMSTLEQRWPIRRCPAASKYEAGRHRGLNVINDDTVKTGCLNIIVQHNQWCLNGREQQDIFLGHFGG